VVFKSKQMLAEKDEGFKRVAQNSATICKHVIATAILILLW